MRKKVIYGIIGILLISLTLIVLNSISNNKLIESLSQITSRQNARNDLSDMVEWMVYDNMDSNNIKLLLTFRKDVGISQITKPDGSIINCGGKSEIGIDYITSLEKEENFVVELADGTSGISKIKTTQNEILDKIQNRMTVDDFIVINDIKYKITDINENEITAACHTPFGSLKLVGMDGYENCVSYLDTACADLYTTESRVLSARSANLDDYNANSVPQTCATAFWLATQHYYYTIGGRTYT